MILTNSVKAAVAAAALTLSISGAKAQYAVVPPVASGSVTVLPYGGYYGPVIAPTPTINYGAPYFNQPYGFSFGNFGYGDQGYGYGFGYPDNGYYGPNVFNGIGDIDNTAPGANPSPGRTVNGTIVQGGIVDPTEPAVPPVAGNETGANAQSKANSTRGVRAPVNLVTVRRAPYNRIAISYNGNTAGVNSITMMLLDSRGREVQQQVLTDSPAQTLLRKPSSARYYRVVLDYNNGMERTITRPLYNQ